MRSALVSTLLCCLLATACTEKADSKAPEEPACGIGLEMKPSTPIATINGQSLACSELYARDKEAALALTREYKSALGKLHSEALNQFVNDRLLQAEADAAKLSMAEFLGSAVTVPPATEEDIQTFYDQAVASGEKLPAIDEIKGDIERFVVEQRQKAALSAFRASLRKKASIETHLPALP